MSEHDWPGWDNHEPGADDVGAAGFDPHAEGDGFGHADDADRFGPSVDDDPQRVGPLDDGPPDDADGVELLDDPHAAPASGDGGDAHQLDAVGPAGGGPGGVPAGGGGGGPVGADPDLPPGADAGFDDPPFPPPLELGSPPEPVDGPPWSDPALLGDAPPAAAPDAGPDARADSGDLLAYAAQDPPTAGDPWAALAASDDPATSALARWWAPDTPA